MKKFVVILIILLLVSASLFATENKNKYRSISLQLKASGSSDTSASTPENWLRLNSNTVGVGLKFGRFSKDNKKMYGCQLKFKYESMNLLVSNELLQLIGGSSVYEYQVVKPNIRIDASFFYRYRVVAPEALPFIKIWLEAKASVYRKWSAENGFFTVSKPYTTGLELIIHPVLSVELTDTLSIETSVDVLSLYGMIYYKEAANGTNSFGYETSLTTTNLNTFIRAAFNIRIIRRF